LGDERRLHLLEAGGIILRERDLETVRCPYLVDRDLLAVVHLPDHALGDLDRLEAASERLGEEAFDEAPESPFEVAEVGHDSGVRGGRSAATSPILPVGSRRPRDARAIVSGGRRSCRGTCRAGAVAAGPRADRGRPAT